MRTHTGRDVSGGRFTFVFDSEAQEIEEEEQDTEDNGFELKNVFKAILKKTRGRFCVLIFIVLHDMPSSVIKCREQQGK